MSKRPVILVAGPTASGKSGLALGLAEALGGTVINADSMQVYRELRILTARPSPEAEARVPHRLYGVISASAACSAGEWRAMAVDAIAEAHRENRIPIVTGGTGLYLRALTQGLAPVPRIPAAVREGVRRRFERIGAAAFHAALAEADPAMARRLPAGDSQRLMRAAEVMEATGRSLASWQREPGEGAPANFAFMTVLVMPPRGALYAAADARLARMIEAGALDEVRALDRLGLGPELPAMKALGMAELRRHLAGELSLAQALEAAQGATRRYAKRQNTWFRHQELPNTRVLEQYLERVPEEIFAIIRRTLLTPGVLNH